MLSDSSVLAESERLSRFASDAASESDALSLNELALLSDAACDSARLPATL